MKARPTIFLSGVSHEFHTFRDAVENEIEMKGCFAENQPGFPPDYRTVEEMLRRKLHEADAIIHIVGFRFGAEPNQRPDGVARRSYTQMEFDIAREMQKPVFVFLSKDASVREPAKPEETAEDAEATALQLAHRTAVQSTNYLHYFFKDQAELCKLAAEIPPVAAAGFQADISRIIKYAPAELIGREAETKILDDAWLKVRRVESPRTNVLIFVALGGEGKTSLVAKWAADLAVQAWPGCDAVFAWSFYSQGTREQTAVSSDLFLAEALTFFGDEAMAKSAAGGFDKGRRLAQLVGERRALLILDGLEPLQYAPTLPTPGELKDQGLSALLKGLAATSRGLCVVTTRYALPDLCAFLGKTVREEKLTRLARAAGVSLLKAHGVTGSDRPNFPHTDDAGQKEMLSEFEALVEDVDGHALTLHLMGSFLQRAFLGDIRRRDRVTFAKADQKTDNGHAFRAMAAYEKWLADGSEEARRELALLSLTGLFDRPATADCLQALLQAPAIAGLTEPLVGLPEEDWNGSLTALQDARLITVNRDAAGTLLSLDAHPLLREYFAMRLRNPGGSQALSSHQIPGGSQAPTGRTIPAQGNALGSDTNRTASPEGAAHGADVSPLQGLGDSEAKVPGALPQAGMVRHVGATEFSGTLGAAGKSSALGATAPGTSAAWREAHKRLYEHLCTTTHEGDHPTLEDLQPLYQAVAHGCQAGLQQEACDKVYVARIKRGEDNYSALKLGAFGSDLGAAACFFEQPWNRILPALSEPCQTWLFCDTAFALRALGRLTEALEPMRAGQERCVKQENWLDAARNACNLSELELTLGEVAEALGDAEQSVIYADRSGDAFERIGNRCTIAAALHETGVSFRNGVKEDRRAKAEALFREAEQMLLLIRPAYPLLCSLSGFQYCDLLLTAGERASWNVECRTSNDEWVMQCHAVSERAARTLSWSTDVFNFGLLTIALDHLTLGRAALYAAILGKSDLRSASVELEQAVVGLRRAGVQDLLVRALLNRAWLRCLEDRRTGAESAQSDLDEAWEIAERGPMPLFQADIHLYRARLFGVRHAELGVRNDEETYPWESPQKDLAEARRLIEKHGYLRRLPELEDAEKTIPGR